jgi:hypothetical protein
MTEQEGKEPERRGGSGTEDEGVSDESPHGGVGGQGGEDGEHGQTETPAPDEDAQKD